MYNKLIYELKLLEDKYEDTTTDSYISRIHNMLINDYPLEEVVEELVSALLNVNDVIKEEFEEESQYDKGWNDAMSEVDSSISYR